MPLAEGELFVREEWREVLERYTVAHDIGVEAIDVVYLHQGEVLLAFTCRTDGAFDDITSLP